MYTLNYLLYILFQYNIYSSSILFTIISVIFFPFGFPLFLIKPSNPETIKAKIKLIKPKLNLQTHQVKTQNLETNL